MTIRYLLDTNILSEPLKPKPDLLVMDNIKYHQYEIQIASIAKANDLILVTRNITDFENLLGLSLENWFSNTST